MATFGEILVRAAKLPHGTGIDPIVLKGYVNDRYHTIINHYPWTRIRQLDTFLQTVAEYTTGTIAITLGATALVGTDTVWTAAMTGRRFRVASRNEWYTFTYVSATTATIDRAFESATETAGTYTIWQPIYTLPADLDVLDSLKLMEQARDLDQINQEELDKLDPSRLLLGKPEVWSPYEDDSANPSLPRIELWPAPDVAVGMPFRYTARIDSLTTSAAIWPSWVSLECLFAGVEADLLALSKDWNGAQYKEAKFVTLLGEMLRKESNREPAQQIRMAKRWTQHRSDRLRGDLDPHDTFFRIF